MTANNIKKMKNYDYDLIIIGGGSAGLSLASGSAQLGVKVLLIAKEELGGDCLHYGCVPSKALLKSAKVAHQIKDAEKYGLELEEKNKLKNLKFNWEKITGRIKKIQKKIQKHDSPERFREMGCDVVFGTAEFTNSHSVKIILNPKLKKLQEKDFKDKKEIILSGRKISIATGSRPRIPKIEGLGKNDAITNEQIFSLKTQPKHLAIIGGGVIASEIAQAMTRLGTKVTIIEKHGKFFGRFTDDIADFMSEKFKKEGVDILLNTETLSVKTKGDKKVLKLKIENSEKNLEVDQILLAVGRVPNTNINLEAAGIEYGSRGIKVDKKLRTTQPHITAIGDVNGYAMFTHAANYEAGIVLTNEILNIPFVKQKADYGKIGWTIYTDPEIASIGEDENSAKKKNLDFEVLKFDFSKNDRALSESASDGFVKIILGKKHIILGAQIMGTRSGEMIREWQLAIEQNIKLDKIARSTYIYPTFGEASKWVSGSYFGPKLFSPKVKKILRFFHKYRGK